MIWSLEGSRLGQPTPPGVGVIDLADGPVEVAPATAAIWCAPCGAWEPGEPPRRRHVEPAAHVTVDGALALPRGPMTTADGTSLSGAALCVGRDVEASGWARAGLAEPQIQTDLDEVGWLSAPGEDMYGHVLVDVLPRAWLLDQVMDEGVPFVVGPAHAEVLADMLSLVGIGRPVVRLPREDQWVRVRRLHLASGARQGHVFDPRRRAVFDTARAAARDLAGAVSTTPHLHLTRAQLATAQPRDLLNRAAVDEAFARSGARLESPEAAPWAEQIAVVAGAGIVSGEAGSAMLNAVFAPPGSRVLLLRGPANRYPLHHGVAALAGLRMHVIEGTAGEGTAGERFGRGSRPWEGGWTVDPALLDSVLADQGWAEFASWAVARGGDTPRDL